MSLFFRQLKHLLPRGRAWSVTLDKPLRRFVEALAVLGSDARDYVDLVWGDMFPATTRQLDTWEEQFGIVGGDLSEDSRRLRLDSVWKAIGGQSPRYVQDTLQAAGFDVYVHEWWDPADTPAVGEVGSVSARNPNSYLYVDPGEDSGLPYLLVNRVSATRPQYLSLCGEAVMQCGEAEALAGNYTQFRDVQKEYVLPADSQYWPYFLYIGGETFPELAVVAEGRRDEFENLVMKICPYQHWLGMLVTYSETGAGFYGWVDLENAAAESQDLGDGGYGWLDLENAEGDTES